jgi:hypothetical protein
VFSQLELFFPSWNYSFPAGIILSQLELFFPSWNYSFPAGIILSQLGRHFPQRQLLPTSSPHKHTNTPSLTYNLTAQLFKGCAF